MKVEVVYELCCGCGVCIDVCSYNALRLNGQVITVSDNCTLCGACIQNCACAALQLPRESLFTDITDLEKYQGVWFWVEQVNGKVNPVSWEIAAKGYELAKKLNTKLTACVMGDKVSKIAQEAIYFGADQVFIVEDTTLAHYRTAPYAAALVNLILQYKPEIFLLGATIQGRDLAGFVAAQLRTGLTADCTSLDIDLENRLLWQTRPAFGGNIIATIICKNHRPQMASVRRHVFQITSRDTSRKGQIVRGRPLMSEVEIATKVIDTIAVQESVNLLDAKILVAGGGGLGGPKGVILLRELAEVLGGAIGVSRTAVDSGWLPCDYQIGQSGVTVHPDIYIACGISGAIQHIVGMRTSRLIIAINTDPTAPIFNVAHYCIVGDLHVFYLC